MRSETATVTAAAEAFRGLGSHRLQEEVSGPGQFHTGAAILSVEGGFKVSSGTVRPYRSSYGADFDDPEIASPTIRGQVPG